MTFPLDIERWRFASRFASAKTETGSEWRAGVIVSPRGFAATDGATLVVVPHETGFREWISVVAPKLPRHATEALWVEDGQWIETARTKKGAAARAGVTRIAAELHRPGISESSVACVFRKAIESAVPVGFIGLDPALMARFPKLVRLDFGGPEGMMVVTPGEGHGFDWAAIAMPLRAAGPTYPGRDPLAILDDMFVHKLPPAAADGVAP